MAGAFRSAEIQLCADLRTRPGRAGALRSGGSVPTRPGPHPPSSMGKRVGYIPLLSQFLTVQSPPSPVGAAQQVVGFGTVRYPASRPVVIDLLAHAVSHQAE